MKLEGTTIGQIRIDKLVGEGGMGAVYRGYDLRLERPVAVKTLHDRYLDDPVGRARFLREAQILSRLDHPGICKVYGIVRHDDADLLVLEWLEGASLGEVMKDAPFERLLDLAIHIGDALAVAHRQQIIHRDLKPDNVIVTADGVVKILDFGIARSAEPELNPSYDPADDDSFFFDDSDLESTWAGGGRRVRRGGDGSAGSDSRPPALTIDGNTVGTIAYMSPEQVGGLPLGVASDAYSFGILLQEMFTGRRAYDPVQPIHLMSLVVVGKTRPLGDVDPQLVELIRSLQALDEGDRPSVREAAESLRALRLAPELRRRRVLRQASLATIAASLLLGIAAVIHGRLEAVRSAAEAREMTRIATEAEWLMRAEHLAPPHDLRPARAGVRELMARLESRSADLDEGGRAAGHLALGRAALALEDVDGAVEHLRLAWDGDMQDPSVAASYGLALAEQVRRTLVKADRQSQDAERERLLEQAAAARDFARELLSTAEKGESLAPTVARLARAQLAFLDDSGGTTWENAWTDAIEEAERASAEDAWFYEGHLLAARVLHRRMLLRIHQQQDEVSAADDLQLALDSLDRAASVGRSDPEIKLARCALIYDAFVLALYSTSEVFQVEAQDGIAACRDALELDPESARGHLFSALLQARAAELVDGPAWEEHLQASIESARHAVALDPQNEEAWRALVMGNMIRSDYQVVRGVDPEEALREVIHACREGLALAPRDVSLLNLLGNAEGIRARFAWSRGQSPLEAVDRATEVYRKAIDLSRSSPWAALSYPQTNLALQAEVGIRWMASQPDQDPRPRAAESLKFARQALASDDKDGYAWTAVAGITSHVARWALDRGDAAEAETWVQQALDAAAEAVRWRGEDDVYAQEVDLRARREAIRLAMQRNDYPEAERHLDSALDSSVRVVELDPEFVTGWILRSRILSLAADLAVVQGRADLSGRYARESLEAAEHGLSLDGEHVPAREQVEEARRRLGMTE